MIPVSNDFLAALTGSHSAVYRARVLTAYQNGTDPMGTELEVISGTVRLDSTADERSSLDLTVIGSWPINQQSSPLAPFGQEIYVERGIEGVNSSGTEWVGLGYHRIEVIEQDDAPDSPIRITGRDRMAAIIEARLLEPRTYEAGTTFLEIFEDLILEIYPSAVLEISGDVAASELREAVTVDRERYDFLRDMATSRSQIMYFNYEGHLVVQEVPDPTTPVWTIAAGEGGVLINTRRQLSRTGVYNAVVAEGSEADLDAVDPPARGVAVDDDESSATYFYGPYGQVPRFYASPLLYTDAQAAQAAASILLQTTGLPYSLDLTLLPNPALEPLDAVNVIMEDGATAEIHVLDTVTIPLSSDSALSANTRATIKFSITP